MTALMQLPPPSKDEMLKELDRELSYRRFVYPKLVLNGKLSQQKADRQNEVLAAIRARIEAGT